MIQRLDVGARMSEVAVHNGTVYLAGQVAEDPSQDIEEQTRQVPVAIDTLLARAGSDKTKLLRVQIYLADVGGFEGMNRVWECVGRARAHAPKGHRAGRAGTAPEWKIEVVATAAA